jgi:tRNA pseudouridine38/39 synthase
MFVVLYCGRMGGKEYDWSKVEFQQFLIKFSYVGTNYQGVAYQDEATPTVEREIFRVLTLTKMIRARETCNFSRCGRTDTGVHAAGNYMSIALRVNPAIDHLAVVNKLLPNDIRLLAMRPVPSDFSARFKCRRRIYKYFQPVWKGLDIDKMQRAAQRLVGEHDFRNYCKMDVEATTNFKRRIFSVNFRVDQPKSVLEIEVNGNAFLWHQIRCIVAVLLAVGEGLEDEQLVSDLLDIHKMPRKPFYALADPSGLVLYDCVFDIEPPFTVEECSETLRGHRAHLSETLRMACVLQAVNGLSHTEAGSVLPWQERKAYREIRKRGTCPSLEEKIESSKKRRKLDEVNEVEDVE